MQSNENVVRKIIAILLCLTLLGCMTACGGQQPAETQQSIPIESPEEANVLEIMILGSSRSVNTFHLLHEVFKD